MAARLVVTKAATANHSSNSNSPRTSGGGRVMNGILKKMDVVTGIVHGSTIVCIAGTPTTKEWHVRTGVPGIGSDRMRPCLVPRPTGQSAAAGAYSW